MAIVGIVHPPQAGRTSGNRVTALRWAARTRQLGHRPFVDRDWDGRRCDLLIALHAEKSAPAIRRWRAARPEAPLVVAATGTDIYGEGRPSPEGIASFEQATSIVLLQKLAIEVLPPSLRSRVRLVPQGAEPPPERAAPRTDVFEVCVLAHVRPVKDPLLAARAVRHLPERSRVLVTLYGGSLDDELTRTVQQEARANPRFEFRGEVSRREARLRLASSRLVLSTSLDECGPNVLSEALAAARPVLATRVPGTVGVLGVGHPGLYEPGDDSTLAELLERAETDATFLEALTRRTRARAFLADPRRELRCWEAVLGEALNATAEADSG